MTATIKPLSDIISGELDRIRAGIQATGLPSGLGIERRVPGGIPRDVVTTIFAETGSFKTTVKNHILISMAEAGHRVMDISWEDSNELTADRYLSRLTGISYGNISGGILSSAERDQLAALADGERQLCVADNILVAENIQPTADAVFRAALNNRVAAVSFDYIQLLGGPGLAKDRLDDVVFKAQRFSRVHKIAVILLSQRKQITDLGREDPRPHINDMLGSSSMRVGSKLILGLYYPASVVKVPTSGYYARFVAANPSHAAVYAELLECWILKNVRGRCAPIHLRVNPATGLLSNADDLLQPYL